MTHELGDGRHGDVPFPFLLGGGPVPGTLTAGCRVPDQLRSTVPAATPRVLPVRGKAGIVPSVERACQPRPRLRTSPAAPGNQGGRAVAGPPAGVAENAEGLLV